MSIELWTSITIVWFKNIPCSSPERLRSNVPSIRRGTKYNFLTTKNSRNIFTYFLNIALAINDVMVTFPVRVSTLIFLGFLVISRFQASLFHSARLRNIIYEQSWIITVVRF